MCSLTVGSVTFHECFFLVRKLPSASLAGSILWLFLGTFYLTFIYKKNVIFQVTVIFLSVLANLAWKDTVEKYTTCLTGTLRSVFSLESWDSSFIRLWQFRCETSWWKLGRIILDCWASSWVFLFSRLKNFSIIHLNKISIYPYSHHSWMSIHIGHRFSWWQNWGSRFSVEDVLDFLFHPQADVSPHAGMLRVRREVIRATISFLASSLFLFILLYLKQTPWHFLFLFSSHEDILEHQ